MAARMAARHMFRRFSSGGKILSEEEKAAENVYIKKIEQEKLEKLARKGPAGEQPTAAGTTKAEAKPNGPETPTASASTDKERNYAVVAGAVAGLAALGWYLKSRSKKTEDIQD